MCLGCGTYTYDEAFAKGLVVLPYEEFKQRMKTYGERARKPEIWGEVKIDQHGLIWTDNKVLVNLFQCYHHLKRVDEWEAKEENRASVKKSMGI